MNLIWNWVILSYQFIHSSGSVALKEDAELLHEKNISYYAFNYIQTSISFNHDDGWTKSLIIRLDCINYASSHMMQNHLKDLKLRKYITGKVKVLDEADAKFEEYDSDIERLIPW